MTYSYLPEYGWARCPDCKLDFDLDSAKPSFPEQLPRNLKAVYVLCPACQHAYQDSDLVTKNAIRNRCFANVKIHGKDSLGNRHPWAVIAELTLQLNDGDLVDAFEKGHNLPMDVYFGVLAGTHKLSGRKRCASVRVPNCWPA